jgi:anti-sigma-K factor RskA
MHRYTAKGARATLVVAPSGEAVLAVRDLPPLRPGTTYEAWVISERRATPAGLFRGSLLALTRPVPPGSTVAVSVEQAGGSPRPTGALLLRAETT